jgi:hypothetical protein
MAPYVHDLMLKRELHLPDVTETVVTGITHPKAGLEINFFEGFDESVFKTDALVCVVSEDMTEEIESGVFRLSQNVPVYETVTLEWTIIGVTFWPNPNVEVYSPFWTEPLIDTVWHPDADLMWPGTDIPAFYAEMNIVSALNTTRDERFFGLYSQSEGDIAEVMDRLGTDDTVCITTHTLYERTRQRRSNVREDGSVFITHTFERFTGEHDTAEAELTVIGTVGGTDENTVLAPFWAVSGIAEDFGQEVYTDSLSAVVVGNADLLSFKGFSTLHYARNRPIYDSRPYAITIFDTEYYDIAIPLMQNIIFINAAVPFIYVIAVCVGFVASFLIMRRRKQEFAIMRSVGFNRFGIFFGALTEQTMLCAVGAGLGLIMVTLTWGYTAFTHPALFVGCYMVGAAFSAVRAAGTDVLRILSERE